MAFVGEIKIKWNDDEHRGDKNKLEPGPGELNVEERKKIIDEQEEINKSEEDDEQAKRVKEALKENMPEIRPEWDARLNGDVNHK